MIQYVVGLCVAVGYSDKVSRHHNIRRRMRGKLQLEHSRLSGPLGPSRCSVNHGHDSACLELESEDGTMACEGTMYSVAFTASGRVGSYCLLPDISGVHVRLRGGGGPEGYNLQWLLCR